jgi:hypothetical protein
MEIIEAAYRDLNPQDVPAAIAAYIAGGKKIVTVIHCGKSSFLFLFTTP